MNFSTLLKNIQFQQLINLSLLIFLAYSNNTLQTSIFVVFMVVFYALLFEYILNFALEKRQFIPYSAAITSMGVVLMVGWVAWYIPYVVIAFAILQKKFIRIDGAHIFNPSNFAVIMAMALFYPKAAPIVGELGKNSIVIAIVLLLGALILYRVNRVAISLAFVLFYTLLEYIVIGSSDPIWHFDEFIVKFYSTSFIVYVIFMLTDPLTTPDNITKQILFALLVAMVAVGLDYFIGMHTRNLFIALFEISVIFIYFYRDVSLKTYLLCIGLSTIISYYILTLKPIYFSM
jgi:hypothetical protein